MILHGRPHDPVAPLDNNDWQLLVKTAMDRFVCEPDWSEYDFISRVLTGHARRRNECEGKDPQGCWNVRCQLGRRCCRAEAA